MTVRVRITHDKMSPPSQDFIRRDLGMVVPSDALYYMVEHEIIKDGKTRHSYNDTTDTIPAVANAGQWGTRTLAQANGDYYPIQDRWQRWFYDFWDWASGYKLPVGKFESNYRNPKNPEVTYQRYTNGSKLELYNRMIMDAKSHTDSYSPEVGARDVVTGRNAGAEKPWEWLCRPTTGALLRILSVNGTILKVKCIDLNGEPPDIKTLEPWQYYFGTQVAVDGSVTRYPDVKEMFKVHGLPPAGTALPLVAPGGYFYIDRDACRKLVAGEIWKPYYP